MYRKIVIFTDLDSTLLDKKSYSWQPALEALNLLRETGASLVMVSSKTCAEMMLYYQELGFDDPFVTENGGAIMLGASSIPDGLWTDSTKVWSDGKRYKFRYIPLGVPYFQLVQDLDAISRVVQVRTRGFSCMTPREVSGLTGLSVDEAVLACKRDFDEPFMVHGRDQDVYRLERVARRCGLKIERGGRFWHLFGHEGKGQAVSILKEMFKTHFREIFCIGLGDSPNDMSFLRLMNLSILFGQSFDERIEMPNGGELWRLRAHGPEAWNSCILKFFSSERSYYERFSANWAYYNSSSFG